MPYIKTPRRNRVSVNLNRVDEMLSLVDIDCAGEINYAITRIITYYLRRKGLNYQRINDVIGALEGSKLEFYRRIAKKYEDEKIRENGDVY